MILDDIPQVVYAPAKAFKKIIENPKYLGAIVILVLFIGLQIAYSYSQFSSTYTENTSPSITNLSNYVNATATSSGLPLWNSISGASFSNNNVDFYNYTIYVPAIAENYTLFGNSSLEIDAANATDVSATLSNAFDVNCGAGGFENLSMALQLVEPQAVPQSAALTLYSVNASNYYTYDLTSSLSNPSDINQWNNLTLPVGSSAQGWTPTGNPSWGNITSLMLNFNYPSATNVTILIGTLFFHGQYQTFNQAFGPTPLISFLEAYSLQFIFSWFLLTALLYIFFKALKANITWKPIFISTAFALFVMVVRSVVNLIATFTLPAVYYPYDLSLGVTSNVFGAVSVPSAAATTYSAQTQAILSHITSLTSTFNGIIEVMFLVSYIWLGVLCTIIVGTLKPEFSMMKRITIAAVSVAVTLLLLLLFVGLV